MAVTKIDDAAVRASAANLGAIMDDMSAFAPLRAVWPKLGNFDLAAQLEAIVDDRRNGVVAHADQLKVSLDEMEKALTKIASEITGVDDNNAARILAAIADLRTRLSA
jgi:hypothetical protein